MLTGHGKLKSYLHRFGLTDDPMCPCEEEEELTTDHLIIQCKKLRNQRNEMIKQIGLVKIGLRQMKHSSIIIYKFL